MRAIGFRASPLEVTYAVLETPTADPDSYSVIGTGKIPIPAALWIPEQLHFIRTVLLDVIDEMSVRRAGIRLTEMVALNRSTFRNNVEGVLQEMLAASSVEHYVAGGNAALSAHMELTDKKLFKQYCEGEKTPPFAKNWGSLSVAVREASLAAIAALKSTPNSVVSVPPATAAAP